MNKTAIHPQADIQILPTIAAIPKADIHVHAEWSPRLDRVLAKREGRDPYDWQAWIKNLMETEPAGHQRLRHISSHLPVPMELDTDENFVARVREMMEESAGDGSLLLEVRFGKDLAERPNAAALFREAEKQVQEKYPKFQAALIPFIFLSWEVSKLNRVVDQYIELAQDGLIYGADLFNQPYHTEADWTNAYKVAERLAKAGLDLTAHVAEVSPANLEAALKVPNIKRLGHGTHAGYHPHLLEQVAESNVTIECSLTCNVIFGAAPSYEEHPLKAFVNAGIPVALCTDDPVQISTTIGREYAIAHQLGFTKSQLLDFTYHAVNAAFIAPEKRAVVLKELDAFKAQM